MEKQIRTRDIKLVPIGNSKGVRIPKLLLQKYGFNQSLLLEETEKGLLLRKKDDKALSWEDTYKAMAYEKENWNDFDVNNPSLKTWACKSSILQARISTAGLWFD